MDEAVPGVAALLTSLLLAWPVISVLRAQHVLDVPNARSSHSKATVRGGGIALMSGVAVGIAISGPDYRLVTLLGLSLAAALVGLGDDLRNLSAYVRLVVQLLLGGAVVMLLAPLPTSWGGLLGAAVIMLGVVGYVNAFNFMDGINGISGMTGAVIGLWYLYLGLAGSDEHLAVGGAVVMGACLGFLPWNFPVARVFLGDVGSYGLGLLIGGLAVVAYATGASPLEAMAPLILYVADTGWTLASRLRRGSPWREAHREHVYQRLCDAGLTHVQTTTVVALATAMTCAAIAWLPAGWALALVAGGLAGYLRLPEVLSKRMRV